MLGVLGSMLAGSRKRRMGGFLSGIGGGGTLDPGGLPKTDADAELLVRAMCNAAKADGRIDGEEARRIMEEVGTEASVDEQDFLRRELESPPIKARDFAAGLRPEISSDVYAVSVLAITVDTMEEAMYLRELRDALGLSHGAADDIHDQLGVPRL